MVGYIVFFLLVHSFSQMQAILLDGRSIPIIITEQYAFSDGDVAVGDVKFKNGFSVPADTTVTLAITQSIDGAIDLHGTGTLLMGSGCDLLLGARCTGFVNGGILSAVDGFVPGVEMESDIVIQGAVQFLKPYRFYLNRHTITFGDGDNPGYFVNNNNISGGLYYTLGIAFSNGVLSNVQDTSGGVQRFQQGESGAWAYTLIGVDLYIFGSAPMTLNGITLVLNQATSSFYCQGKGNINNATIEIGNYCGLEINPGVSLYLPNGLYAGGFRNSVSLNKASLVTGQSIIVGSSAFGGNGAFSINGTCTLKAIGTAPGQNTFTFQNGMSPTLLPGAKLILDGVLYSEL